MAFAEFELGTNQLVMWRLSGREPRQTAVLEPTATMEDEMGEGVVVGF